MSRRESNELRLPMLSMKSNYCDWSYAVQGYFFAKEWSHIFAYMTGQERVPDPTLVGSPEPAPEAKSSKSKKKVEVVIPVVEVDPPPAVPASKKREREPAAAPTPAPKARAAIKPMEIPGTCPNEARPGVPSTAA